MFWKARLCKRFEFYCVLLCCQTSSSSLLKANVEYLKQNYMKAMKVLGAPPKSPIVTDSGECVSAFYFNNLACLRFHLGRYHLGAYFLCKAIEENDSALNGFPPLDRGKPSCICSCTIDGQSSLAMPLSGRPLSVLGVNCRHILLYNLGLQQLFAGQPMAAFESLLEVVQVYHANPRLWFRLAEACIATHAKVTQGLAFCLEGRAWVGKTSGCGWNVPVVMVLYRIQVLKSLVKGD